ncbi:beta-1 adrenergic receptor-like [Littorina saxatilis]
MSEKVLTREDVLMTLYLSVLLVLSVMSNGTIGCVFYKKPQLLTVSNNFVLNLACCQLGLSLLVLPFSAASVAGADWLHSAMWCRCQSYLLVVLLVVLHYSLLAISLDRNYAIVNSLRYPYIFTHRLGNTVIAGTWVLGLSVGLPPLLGWGAFRLEEAQALCSVDWAADTGYTTLFLALVIVCPLLVQCWCYLSIFRAALGHTKRSAKVFPSSTATTTSSTTTATTTTTSGSNTAGTSTSDSYEEDPGHPLTQRVAHSTECKAVKTLVLIAAAYLVCWTLFVVVALLKWGGEHVAPSVDAATSALLFLSCILNPLIYGFMNRVTRFEIVKFWCRISRRLSGRPPPPFNANHDDPVSSTWTTTLSSGRQTTGLWVTPSQRMRRNSKSLACAVRNTEMLTIREETEMEEECERDGEERSGVVLSVPAAGASTSQCFTRRSGLAVAEAQAVGLTPERGGNNSQTCRLQHSGSDNPQTVLNPVSLCAQYPEADNKRRACGSCIPASSHHDHHNHHRHHLHRHHHQRNASHNHSNDVWDLFSVDPKLHDGADQCFPSTSHGKSRHCFRRHSAETISTRSRFGTATDTNSNRTRTNRSRWKFVQNIQRFLRRNSIKSENVSKRADKENGEQDAARTTFMTAKVNKTIVRRCRSTGDQNIPGTTIEDSLDEPQEDFFESADENSDCVNDDATHQHTDVSDSRTKVRVQGHQVKDVKPKRPRVHTFSI